MITIPKKPVNYLNNKDILKEIHLSKNSYCSYSKPEYHQYDLIIDYLDNTSLDVNLEYTARESTVQKAREARALRIDIENNLTKGTTDPLSIPISDLIFRVMTWDHVPVAPKQPRKTEKKSKVNDIFDFDDSEGIDFTDLEDPSLTKEMGLDDMIHVKVNFPPFQHYKFNDLGNLVCVGKSHWIGDVDTGSFSKDHGTATNTLAKMWLKLVEKYALRFNWRGYTYNDEMRGTAILQLAYVGLRFNEAKSANPFAYYTAAINNSFCRVLNSEKKNQNIRDDILEMNNLNPSWTRQFSHEHERHKYISDNAE